MVVGFTRKPSVRFLMGIRLGEESGQNKGAQQERMFAVGGLAGDAAVSPHLYPTTSSLPGLFRGRERQRAFELRVIRVNYSSL